MITIKSIAFITIPVRSPFLIAVIKSSALVIANQVNASSDMINHIIIHGLRPLICGLHSHNTILCNL